MSSTQICINAKSITIRIVYVTGCISGNGTPTFINGLRIYSCLYSAYEGAMYLLCKAIQRKYCHQSMWVKWSSRECCSLFIRVCALRSMSFSQLRPQIARCSQTERYRSKYAPFVFLLFCFKASFYSGLSIHKKIFYGICYLTDVGLLILLKVHLFAGLLAKILKILNWTQIQLIACYGVGVWKMGKQRRTTGLTFLSAHAQSWEREIRPMLHTPVKLRPLCSHALVAKLLVEKL